MAVRYCIVPTLEMLHARVIEEGNCWLWQGAMGGKKGATPLVRFRGRMVPAYVAVWLLRSHLQSVPEGLVIWRKCGNHRCISPDCIRIGSRRQFSTWAAASGVFASNPASLAAKVVANRAHHAKLADGMESARAIRASKLTTKELAQIHNVTERRITAIRRGEAWREGVIPQSSIFNMGGVA